MLNCSGTARTLVQINNNRSLAGGGLGTVSINETDPDSPLKAECGTGEIGGEEEGKAVDKLPSARGKEEDQAVDGL